MFKRILLFSFFIVLHGLAIGQGAYVIEKLKAHKLTIVEINTVNQAAITSKDDYLKASIKIHDYLNNKFVELKDSTEIKGRGNSTWELPKKPYRLKTFKSISIGGMPSSKHWALLANFEDKSASRTKLASDLANYLGVSYAPRSIPVELVLNGEHKGAYELIEIIKIDAKRIDIATINTKNDITTGGAIFELNLRRDETYNFYTNVGVPISIKEPDDLNAKTEEIALKHFNYLVDILNTAEGALYGNNFADTAVGYAKYFNVQAAITWYLTEEILKNFDIGEYSVFKYIDTKNKNKITYGPIWDFDLSAGVREGPTGFKAKVENTWMRRFFEDPNFEQSVKDKWNSSRARLLTNMISSVNQNARKLKNSQAANASIWDGFLRPNDKSFIDDVNYLKAWLYERVQWLDAQWSDTPILYNAIVQDYAATTDEDVVIKSTLYASESKHTNPHFYLVSKPKLGQVKFLNSAGDFIYTPNLNVHGVDTFYYSNGDSTQLVVDSGMVVIQINPINDIPVAKPLTLEVLEDNSIVKNVSNGLSLTTADADGEALKYFIVDTTKNGVLKYAQDGSFTYTPNKDFNGLDSFTYKATDIATTSNIATYTIKVISVNDEPVFTKDTLFYQMYRNEIIDFTTQEDFVTNITDVDNSIGDFEYKFETPFKNGTVVAGRKKAIYYPDQFYTGVDYLNFRVFDQIGYSKKGVLKIRILPDSYTNSFNNILLYPNPSKGLIYIDDLISDNVLLFNYQGNKLRDFSFTQIGNKLQINAQSLPKGYYLVYVFYKNNIVAIKKLNLL